MSNTLVQSVGSGDGARRLRCQPVEAEGARRAAIPASAAVALRSVAAGPALRLVPIGGRGGARCTAQPLRRFSRPDNQVRMLLRTRRTTRIGLSVSVRRVVDLLLHRCCFLKTLSIRDSPDES